MKTYSDEELACLINEVEVAFNENLNKAEEAVKEEKIEKTEETKVETVAKSEETTELAKTEEVKEEPKKTINELYASMTKSELEAHKSAIESVSSIEKTEEVKEEKIEKSEIDSLKEENDALKKSIEKLTSVLSKNVTPAKSMPKQKAIAEIGIVKKTEEETVAKSEEKDFSKLSKKEIAKILSGKVREGNLSKSDREAVVSFYSDAKGNIESIKHLL